MVGFPLLIKYIFHRLQSLESLQMSDQAKQQKTLLQYYKAIYEQIQSIEDLRQPSISNRTKSFMVTLLKGNQSKRQIPKELNGKIARELRLLAIDRSFTQSMYEFSDKQKKIMNDFANKINSDRDRQGNLGDALRDLVRLARLHNIAREEGRGNEREGENTT